MTSASASASSGSFDVWGRKNKLAVEESERRIAHPADKVEASRATAARAAAADGLLLRQRLFRRCRESENFRVVDCGMIRSRCARKERKERRHAAVNEAEEVAAEVARVVYARTIQV